MSIQHFCKTDLKCRYPARVSAFFIGRNGMTIQEASERYQIPMHILREYEHWGLCGAVKKVMGAWQYDDTDLERLSTIMTLHDIGFTGKRWRHICVFFWKETPPAVNVCKCWSKNALRHWTRFTSRNASFSDWTVCAMKCGK